MLKWIQGRYIVLPYVPYTWHRFSILWVSYLSQMFSRVKKYGKKRIKRGCFTSTWKPRLHNVDDIWWYWTIAISPNSSECEHGYFRENIIEFLWKRSKDGTRLFSHMMSYTLTQGLVLMGKLFISDVLSCQKIWKKEDKKRMFYIDMETTPA